MPGAKPNPGDTGGLKRVGGAVRAGRAGTVSDGQAAGGFRAPSGGTGTGGGTTTATPPSGGGTGTESSVGGGGQQAETGGQQTEPQTETGTETGEISGLNIHLETDTSSGEGSAGVTSGGQPIIETEVNNETGVGGTSVETSEPVAQTGLETETHTAETTVETSTQTSDGNLTLDVSAGTDVSQTDLEGAGSKDDATEEAIGADNDDCNLLNPLSIPEHCL